MRVLIVGSGGREHALAWKLSQSAAAPELHAAPGNPGIAALGECHPVRADDVEAVLELAMSLDAELVVIGPETPLVYGLASVLRGCGIPAFGPSLDAARIEGSKLFAKEVMEAAGVPTAATLSVARPPCVVKANNLAAGKGVFVCRTRADVDHALSSVSAFDAPQDHPSPGGVLIEELLEGEEVSLFALTDGSRVLPLAAARDYKRAGGGDTGPNTGGMGAFSPVPDLGAAEIDELVAQVHEPVLAELARRGTPFIGLLYAGLMLTDDGPRVLEFNCRFGDPETQAVLPRTRGDLLEALAAAAAGDLTGVSLAAGPQAAVTVVVAAGGYPERGDAGSPITGVDEAESLGALVFHAGTARRGDTLVTNGGRILDVTGVGDDLERARALAYEATARISFEGSRYRHDVAQPEASRVV